MAIKTELGSIVSATELVKNFAKVREQAKKGTNLIIFKNNKPDLAVLDIANYEKLLQMAEQYEDLQIRQIIEEWYKNDDGTRYNTDEILKMRQQILETQSSNNQLIRA